MKKKIVLSIGIFFIVVYIFICVGYITYKKTQQKQEALNVQNAITPIVDIHSIENKSENETNSILGSPDKKENTAYGNHNTYLNGKVEILFLDNQAAHITVYSDKNDFRLLGINEKSLDEWSVITKNENDRYISYNNLENLYKATYFKDNNYFLIITKKIYENLSDYKNNNSNNNSINSTDNNTKKDANNNYSIVAGYSKTLIAIKNKYVDQYTQEYYADMDSLLNDIYTDLKNNTAKSTFTKIEQQEIEWIKYKEQKKDLKDKIYDTEMRIKDLLYMMDNFEKFDVVNDYTPYFKR